MVRTRFAPSPTGKMHIGGVRTALFAWLFARQNNGVFYLRIDDTDQKRFDPEGTEAILDGLRWFNLNWDEGITDKEGNEKGNLGPYMQSKRLDIYKKYANELIEKRLAYYCFCSSERLEKLRKEQEANKQAPMYDRACLKLSQEEIERKIKTGEQYVIRFKVPEKGKTQWKDLVRGKLEFENRLLDDPVILKSDSYPTYHFAHIIDDHLMQTSHIIRGEEWLPSTPKHILLFRAFGWDIPEYAHLPVVTGNDKKKLGKRHGSTKVSDFRDLGYLPDAVINYIALLGWNPKTTQEIFSREELTKSFDINKLNKAGAIFSYEKLDWFNQQYIKKLDLDELTEKCFPFFLRHPEKYSPIRRGRRPRAALALAVEQGSLTNSEKIVNQELNKNYIKKIVSVERDRIKKLSDITENIDFFLFDDIDYPAEKLIWKKSDKNNAVKNLEIVKNILSEIPEEEWTIENLESKIMPEAEKAGKGNMLWPMRYALTGADKSPSPIEVAWVLGKDISTERIEKGLKLLQ